MVETNAEPLGTKRKGVTCEELASVGEKKGKSQKMIQLCLERCWQGILDQRWLLGSTTRTNEYLKLELSGAQEPTNSSNSQESLRGKDPKFVFLMEMKLHKDIMNQVKHELGYTQGVAVSSEGNSGGLALLWKPGTRVEVRKYSCWCIDTLVDYEGNGDV